MEQPVRLFCSRNFNLSAATGVYIMSQRLYSDATYSFLFGRWHELDQIGSGRSRAMRRSISRKCAGRAGG
jgi:hypothetical protein